MMPSKEHIARVHQELTKAGMTKYGHIKMTSRYLPAVIAEDEHVKGVVYGACGRGLALLVATDKRVIYLERKPGFVSSDEISYEVVAGVKFFRAGMASAITLHTRVGEYTLRYVNNKCADIFLRYIEHQIERPNNKGHIDQPDDHQPRTATLTAEAKDFLQAHQAGVLSTADRTGNVSGAAIYYLLGHNDKLYILTKSDTNKARNIRNRNEVAFTVFDQEKTKTVQVKGTAEVESDMSIRHYVFSELTKPRIYDGEVLTPPLTNIDAGAYVPYRITPTFVQYTDYKKNDRIIPTHPHRA